MIILKKIKNIKKIEQNEKKKLELKEIFRS
jgi:hypothetical protein